MGIHNRDYYKQNASGAWADWGLYGLTPVVKYIIIANVVVFIAQVLFTREVPYSPLEEMRKINRKLDKLLSEKGDTPEGRAEIKKEHPELKEMIEAEEHDSVFLEGKKISLVQEWCELDTRKLLRGQVWRPLTHAFCHDRLGVFHILFNMLFLYWFGCTIESMYGSREFLLFYLTAAVLAALAFVGLDLWTGSRIPAVGASGAVMAVTMLYAMHFPRETICFFRLFCIEMRWLMILYIIFDLHPLLLALAGDQYFTGVGHAAHLGGLAFGFLYGRYEWRLLPLVDRLPLPTWSWKPARPRGRSRSRSRAPVRLYQPAPSDPDMDQVDEILDKIHRLGTDSLNDDERALLQRASERIKIRRESE